MYFIPLPQALSACRRFVFLVLAGAGVVMPMTVSAQDGFLIIPANSLNKYDAKVDVRLASCKGISLSAPKQTVQCVLEQKSCVPGKCPFEKDSDDYPPLALTIGKSKYNPTCAWVFDWTRYTYTYWCW